ncbi:MAG: endonuclease III, partial [Patescibacteria group bacterium]|nr:endonuclease III [Patescibacteria group bacterium]
MTREEKVKLILDRLYRIYPHPKTALQYKTPWELLVATILSAQATDKLVNSVTPQLFGKFKTIKDFVDSTVEEIDKEISRVNFHYSKAKSIQGAAKMV